MTAELRKDVLHNAFWIAGLGIALVALIGGTFWRLNRERAGIDSIQDEIRRKRSGFTTSQDLARILESTETELRACNAMIDSEPRRVAALSSAARAAGVTILSLENSEPEAVGGEQIVACSHSLKSIGNYAQLASFFDRVYASQGMAAIERLEIRPDNDLADGSLQASLSVTWYGASIDAEYATGEGDG